MATIKLQGWSIQVASRPGRGVLGTCPKHESYGPERVLNDMDVDLFAPAGGA